MPEPILVHVLTKKGKGYQIAENDPIGFYAVSGKFDPKTGQALSVGSKTTKKYTDVFSETLVNFARDDQRLVAITAEPLAPSPFLAIIIGAIGGIIVFFGTGLLLKLKIDDVVGAIPVHGFAGIFGTLVVPLSNSAASFGAQLYGIIWVNIFVFIAAFVVWYLMKITMGIRISEEAEKLGTDKSEVGVMAYMIRD